MVLSYVIDSDTLQRRTVPSGATGRSERKGSGVPRRCCHRLQLEPPHKDDHARPEVHHHLQRNKTFHPAQRQPPVKHDNPGAHVYMGPFSLIPDGEQNAFNKVQ